LANCLISCRSCTGPSQRWPGSHIPPDETTADPYAVIAALQAERDVAQAREATSVEKPLRAHAQVQCNSANAALFEYDGMIHCRAMVSGTLARDGFDAYMRGFRLRHAFEPQHATDTLQQWRRPPKMPRLTVGERHAEP